MERRRLPSSINKSVPHDEHRRASSIKTSRRTEKDKGGASGPRPGAADSRSCSRRPPCRLQSKVARESRRRLSQFEPFSARTANPARLALPRREGNYSKWPSPTNLPVDTERSSPNRRFAIRTNAKRTRHCRNESAIVKQHSRTEIFVARLGIAITPPRVPCTCNRIDKSRNSASRFDRSRRGKVMGKYDRVARIASCGRSSLNVRRKTSSSACCATMSVAGRRSFGAAGYVAMHPFVRLRSDGSSSLGIVASTVSTFRAPVAMGQLHLRRLANRRFTDRVRTSLRSRDGSCNRFRPSAINRSFHS